MKKIHVNIVVDGRSVRKVKVILLKIDSWLRALSGYLSEDVLKIDGVNVYEKILGVKSRMDKDDTEHKTAEIPETYTNSIGMKFILIQAGEFMMGSPPDEAHRWDDEGPVHKVKLNKPFYLGMHPVIQSSWKTIMGNNPSHFKDDAQSNNMPVEKVSWSNTHEFIRNLNRKECTNKYRLPTDSEWEYAARAGTTIRYSFKGDESKLGEYAWYSENSGSSLPKRGKYFGYNKDYWVRNKWNGKPHPVGHKKPNLVSL